MIGSVLGLQIAGFRRHFLISGAAIPSPPVAHGRSGGACCGRGWRGCLGFGALDADGANEQPHLVFLPGENMLDAGPDLRFGGVDFYYPLGRRLASGLPAVDAAYPAPSLEPRLVGLAAIGGIGPDVRGGAIRGLHIPEHASVEPGRVDDFAFEDEPEGPADRHAALVGKTRDRDVDLRLAIRCRSALDELQRPARVRVLLGRPCWLAGPDIAGGLACFLWLPSQGRSCAAWAQPPMSHQQSVRPWRDSRTP